MSMRRKGLSAKSIFGIVLALAILVAIIFFLVLPVLGGAGEQQKIQAICSGERTTCLTKTTTCTDQACIDKIKAECATAYDTCVKTQARAPPGGAGAPTVGPPTAAPGALTLTADAPIGVINNPLTLTVTEAGTKVEDAKVCRLIPGTTNCAPAIPPPCEETPGGTCTLTYKPGQLGSVSEETFQASKSGKTAGTIALKYYNAGFKINVVSGAQVVKGAKAEIKEKGKTDVIFTGACDDKGVCLVGVIDTTKEYEITITATNYNPRTFTNKFIQEQIGAMNIDLGSPTTTTTTTPGTATIELVNNECKSVTSANLNTGYKFKKTDGTYETGALDFEIRFGACPSSANPVTCVKLSGVEICWKPYPSNSGTYCVSVGQVSRTFDCSADGKVTYK